MKNEELGYAINPHGNSSFFIFHSLFLLFTKKLIVSEIKLK